MFITISHDKKNVNDFFHKIKIFLPLHRYFRQKSTILNLMKTTRQIAESTMRIIEAILAVPVGKVSSYRDIALKAGLRNGSRQVAWVLHSLSEKHKLPWHRIIRADGFIALGAGECRELQAALLRSEGVEVTPAGRVCLPAE
jgi:methylated-DNA-protein-cysteine methyltransferase-like protein